MARGKGAQPLEHFPVGMIAGASEFESFYPDETMKLGSLIAYWSLAEDALCSVLSVPLKDRAKVRAIFYSTTNHKARRDLVFAAATASNLDERAKDYLEFSLATLKEAADARNKIIHGLFRVNVRNEELLSIRRRPTTKTPIIAKSGIMKELSDAISLCERAVGVLHSTVMAIAYPDLLDKIPDLNGERKP